MISRHFHYPSGPSGTSFRFDHRGNVLGPPILCRQQQFGIQLSQLLAEESTKIRLFGGFRMETTGNRQGLGRQKHQIHGQRGSGTCFRSIQVLFAWFLDVSYCNICNLCIECPNRTCTWYLRFPDVTSPYSQTQPPKICLQLSEIRWDMTCFATETWLRGILHRVRSSPLERAQMTFSAGARIQCSGWSKVMSGFVMGFDHGVPWSAHLTSSRSGRSWSWLGGTSAPKTLARSFGILLLGIQDFSHPIGPPFWDLAINLGTIPGTKMFEWTSDYSILSILVSVLYQCFSPWFPTTFTSSSSTSPAKSPAPKTWHRTSRWAPPCSVSRPLASPIQHSKTTGPWTWAVLVCIHRSFSDSQISPLTRSTISSRRLVPCL